MNDFKINDVFYLRIVIPLNSISSKSKYSNVFADFDFKIALSFAIIGSIATVTLRLINNART